MPLGLNIQGIATNVIRQFGELVTVTLRPSTQGGTPTSSDVYALPQPMNSSESSGLRTEGVLNASEPNPVRFVLAGDSTLTPESIGWVTWNSQKYRVLNTNPGGTMQGYEDTLMVYGVRT